MVNNMVSKSQVEVGMSTTNVHLLQFKIQSHFQKNVDFECRYIRTHSEGGEGDKKQQQQQQQNKQTKTKTKQKNKKQNKTNNKQTNTNKQTQSKTEQKAKNKQTNKQTNRQTINKQTPKISNNTLAIVSFFSSKFFHFNCHLEYETIRSTGKMVHSNTKNASSSISSVLLTHNQYILPLNNA